MGDLTYEEKRALGLTRRQQEGRADRAEKAARGECVCSCDCQNEPTPGKQLCWSCWSEVNDEGWSGHRQRVYLRRRIANDRERDRALAINHLEGWSAGVVMHYPSLIAHVKNATLRQTSYMPFYGHDLGEDAVAGLELDELIVLHKSLHRDPTSPHWTYDPSEHECAWETQPR